MGTVVLQRNYISTSTRHQTTAHLAQTMTLLYYNTEELVQHIESELASNPALELIEERRCPMCHRVLGPKEICPVCSTMKSPEMDGPVVFLSPMQDFSHDYRGGSGIDFDDLPEDNFSVQKEDLASYVRHQVSMDLVGIEHQIAEHILSNVNGDGILEASLFEIARYFHVPVSKVQAVQAQIQRCDPIGVASLSTSDAMLIQLEVLKETQDVPELAFRLLAEGMGLLSKRKFDELSELLDVDEDEIFDCVQFIAENLNPFPGRGKWGTVRQPVESPVSVYHQPDIIIRHLNEDDQNELSVEIVMPVSGILQLSQAFKEAMSAAEEDKKDEWKKDYDRASLLVKCLQQRGYTILRLMQLLVKIQENYIINGEKYLKPLTRAKMAEALEVHESTISRAVSKKTVQLPSGRIVPLSGFFSRNMNIRSVLRDLVENEKKPLSDSALAKELEKQGFTVARRTVAKYRSMEGILPAHLRKNVHRHQEVVESMQNA